MSTNLFLLCWLAFFYLILIVHGCLQIRKGKKWMEGLAIAPLVIAGVMAAVQVGVGIAQKSKANKLARRNKRPELEDNPYLSEQYDLTASMAGQGLSDGAKQTYLTNNDRMLSSTIDAIFKSGGSANNIAGAYEGSQNGLRALALDDQQQKNRNLINFLNFGIKDSANQERDQWYLNQYVPYQDNASAASELSKQGMDSIFKGFNTIGGAAISMSNSGARDTGGGMNNLSGIAPSASTYGMQTASTYNSSPAAAYGNRISANAPGAMGDGVNYQMVNTILNNYLKRAV